VENLLLDANMDLRIIGECVVNHHLTVICMSIPYLVLLLYTKTKKIILCCVHRQWCM